MLYVSVLISKWWSVYPISINLICRTCCDAQINAVVHVGVCTRDRVSGIVYSMTASLWIKSGDRTWFIWWVYFWLNIFLGHLFIDRFQQIHDFRILVTVLIQRLQCCAKSLSVWERFGTGVTPGGFLCQYCWGMCQQFEWITWTVRWSGTRRRVGNCRLDISFIGIVLDTSTTASQKPATGRQSVACRWSHVISGVWHGGSVDGDLSLLDQQSYWSCVCLMGFSLLSRSCCCQDKCQIKNVHSVCLSVSECCPCCLELRMISHALSVTLLPRYGSTV